MSRLLSVVLLCLASVAGAAERPNILWISSEDNGPELGCYGDAYAVTPNIDALAATGLRYEVCWSNAPVCAPARTTIISGLYPTSTGAEHMRSLVRLPAGMQMFPQLLRGAGYFTSNTIKEDYNLQKPGKVWDVEGGRQPWRKRGDGQPFFSVINITTSHESQIRKRPHTLVHDPAAAPIPAYHPDTPEVRHDWAQYYDKVTEMDGEVGEILASLDADGLTDSTIVFYWGDHGAGMPRSKRWPFDSGLHVPLIVRIPEQYQSLRPADYVPGGATARLTAFIDFAPTVLSLAGIPAPKSYQGTAFLGPQAGEPNLYLHGFRGRMDERTDCIRSVTDGRYVYVRQYMPLRSQAAHVGYMYQMPTMQVLARLHAEGKLNAAQRQIFDAKPCEQLFDLQHDPDEVENLADSPEHQDVLERLRTEQQAQIRRVRDVGFLPEAMLHARCEAANLTPYELGHDPQLYPLEEIVRTAELASPCEDAAGAAVIPQLVERLDDADAAVRYWAVLGLAGQEKLGFEAAPDRLRTMLADPSPSVRIAAAEFVARNGTEADQQHAGTLLLAEADFHTNGVYAAAAALEALDGLLHAVPQVVMPRSATVKELPLPGNQRGLNPRAKEYPARLKATILEELSNR